ncbi:MAG: hypothetical protein ABIX44_03975, partial [Cryobacterium sp.]
MVMSGPEERVVFLHDLPGDEALLTGGTIARLRADGATVVVLFAAMAPRDRESWLGEALAEARATAAVIGSVDEALLGSATRIAESMAVPVYLARRVAQSAGQRLTAIDVSDEIENKLSALAAYPDRWTIVDNAVALPDGSLLAVTGTETYLRPEPPRPADIPPTPLARVVASVAALVVGAVFGTLGTVAHQSVVQLGPVALPFGLILALIAVSALLVGLLIVYDDRII